MLGQDRVVDDHRHLGRRGGAEGGAEQAVDQIADQVAWLPTEGVEGQRAADGLVTRFDHGIEHRVHDRVVLPDDVEIGSDHQQVVAHGHFGGAVEGVAGHHHTAGDRGAVAGVAATRGGYQPLSDGRQFRGLTAEHAQAARDIKLVEGQGDIDLRIELIAHHHHPGANRIGAIGIADVREQIDQRRGVDPLPAVGIAEILQRKIQAFLARGQRRAHLEAVVTPHRAAGFMAFSHAHDVTKAQLLDTRMGGIVEAIGQLADKVTREPHAAVAGGHRNAFEHRHRIEQGIVLGSHGDVAANLDV